MAPSVVKPSSPAKKASRKPVKYGSSGSNRSEGGSATQTVLNVITTLLTVPGVASVASSSSLNQAVPRKMVAQFATTQGVKGKSSTFANALTKLKKEHKIVVTSTTIEITPKGMECAKPIKDMSASTNEEYQSKVFEQHKITGNALNLVRILQDGNKHSKKHVCLNVLNMKMNSTWSNMLTKLKKFNIVTFDKDSISLSDDMYPLGRGESLLPSLSNQPSFDDDDNIHVYATDDNQEYIIEC